MGVCKSDSQYLYYDANQTQTFSYTAPIVIKMLEGQSKLRILELGCGNGYFCSVLSKMGHVVIGVDVSKTGIENARKNFPQIQFIESDICSLPNRSELGAGNFDVVIAIDVIEHFQHPKELITVAQKFLKENGQLIISTPYHGYWKNLAMSLLDKWDRHFDVAWEHGHIKFFSVRTLKKILEEESFHDIKFKFAGRIPAFWKSIVCIGKK